MNALGRFLEQEAKRLGFAASGGVDLDLAQDAFHPHGKHYQSWIERGSAGEMAYLVRGEPARLDPRKLFAPAQSVFCVMIPYVRQGVGNGTDGPKFARYLRGPEYHDWMKSRLAELLRSAQAQFPGLEGKVCVDTSAVLERAWAMLSGLGWVGKNTLLIHPKLGSYLFLGEILLNQTLDQGPRLLKDYCGHCTRCLDACPTQAFRAPRDLDARECIAYLTLERRGWDSQHDRLGPKFGAWIAGCDVCQEVCPFNIKPSRESTPWENEPLFSELVRNWSEWIEALELQESPVDRVKPVDFERNYAIALGNQLESDPELRERLKAEVSRLVALMERATLPALRQAWARCLDRLR